MSNYLPSALAREYTNNNSEFIWQLVFPARNRSQDPQTGVIRRHHIHETVIHKAGVKAILSVLPADTWSTMTAEQRQSVGTQIGVDL